MATIRTDGVAGKLSADLASGGTSMSSAGLADLAAVASPDTAKITLFQTDTNGRITKREVVYVTAHTASATSATITRGQEGTTAQAWNGTTAPDSWVHAPTARDFAGPGTILAYVSYSPGTEVTTSTTNTTATVIDSTNLAVTFTAPPSGEVEVMLEAAIYLGVQGNAGTWSLMNGATEVIWAQVTALGVISRPALHLNLSGLTSGSSYTLTWAQRTSNTGSAVSTRYGGTIVGPAIMKVTQV